ncbi:MAG: dihydrodipicolinate reductase C-terminal domain-containing protein [Patescibacteria group bacterium]|nr:dihydrodipicolinate reductase C-terminal domain-containing protein [Patescibacteria group bacterium]
MEKTLKLFVVGSGAFATNLIEMIKGIEVQQWGQDGQYIISKKDLDNYSCCIIYASNANRFEQVIESAQAFKVPVINGCTDIKYTGKPNRKDVFSVNITTDRSSGKKELRSISVMLQSPVLMANNWALPMGALIASFVQYAVMFGAGAQSMIITEFHREAKKSTAGTAMDMIQSIAGTQTSIHVEMVKTQIEYDRIFNDLKRFKEKHPFSVISIRSNEISQKMLDISNEDLDKHAVHLIEIDYGNDNFIKMETFLSNRQMYASGVIALAGKLICMSQKQVYTLKEFFS